MDSNESLQQHGVKIDGYLQENDDLLPQPRHPLPRPVVKGGPLRYGVGWEESFDDKVSPTHPMGMMTQELRKEVTKYGSLCQLTYANFVHFNGTGRPQVLNPANFLPDVRKQSFTPAKEPTWVDTKQADVLSHIVLEDERFYLKATSGLFPGELSSANILRRLLPSIVYGPGTAPQSRNWIGYVAVSERLKERNDERDLVVVFRGTQAKTEWISDIVWQMVPWSELQQAGDSNIKVAKGFETMYRRFDSTPGNTVSIQGQVHVAVRTLLEKYSTDDTGKITSISVTGHSLGGALASLCAFDIAWSRINRLGDKQTGDYVPVTAFTFEAPRVGNTEYAKVFEAQGRRTAGASGPVKENGHFNADVLEHFVNVKMLRVINRPDIVPKEPCLEFSWRYALIPWRWWKLLRFLYVSIKALFSAPRDGYAPSGYVHGGRVYEVDTREWPKTSYPPLKSTKGLGDKIGQWHDLLLPLYLIDPEHRVVGDQALDADAINHY